MQYQKEIAQTEEYDVVVCGAGVAGFAAAVQSARLGARTALLERYGMPGGVLTVGGNNEIGLFYRGSRQIISGIGWELVQRLKVKGWADIPEFDEKYDHSQQNVIVNGPWQQLKWTPCVWRRVLSCFIIIRCAMQLPTKDTSALFWQQRSLK